MTGLVFDTGALIALERGDRGVAALVEGCRAHHDPIIVPAGCVAQAWRHPSRQARVARLLRMSNVDVLALDDGEARRIGLLLAASGRADVVDAHVALTARQSGHTVVTSDPDDISALAPSVQMHQV